MKIYLAGKIAVNDWRHDIVAHLAGEGSNEPGRILADRIRGPHNHLHDYTGPYFTSMGHGGDHGDNSHGNGLAYYGNAQERARVVNVCLRGIQECDMVFAWLDTLDAFGTLAEIGFAVNAGKRVYISGPQKYPDLWFVYELARQSGGGFYGPDKTPKDGLDVALVLASHVGVEVLPELSPIEQRFYDSWLVTANGYGRKLVPQYELFGGKYRLDFAEPESKIGIELDGYDYHSSKEAFTKDRKRQREIEAAGWRVIRFSGSEVYKDAAGCASEALAFITGQTTTDAGRLPY